MQKSSSNHEPNEEIRPDSSPTEFEHVARRAGRRGKSSVIIELLLFLQESNRWWLLPVLLALLVVSFLIFLGGTVAAPFIYTLF